MRSGIRVGIGVGLLLVAGAAFAQTAADAQPQAGTKRLTFVQATVKLAVPRDLTSPQPGQARVGVAIHGTQVEFTYLPVRALIMMAYQVKQYQISGLSTLNDRQYDIAATMPEGATAKDLPTMLQALLEDRFKLVAHRETKELPVLALVVAKGGPKLKESTVAQATVPNTPLKSMEMRAMTPDGPVDMFSNPHMIVSVASNHMDMAGLADLLTRLLHGGNREASQSGGAYVNDSDWRQVVNQTGLTGAYEVTVKSSLSWPTVMLRVEGAIHVDTSRPFANDSGANMNAHGPVSDDPDATLVFSLEDLGLKLEKSKAPVERLVVDHVEMIPAEK
jgi:uncharacterized protein (TIGR03435 family)